MLTSLLLLTQLANPIQGVYPQAPLPHHWQRPIAGELTNPFGNSYRYFSILRMGHTGVDLIAPVSTDVVASESGKVVRVVNTLNRRYGRYVVIQHSPKLYSLYGHLSTISVKVGQKIERGKSLGTVGQTGGAGYPHLHFEVLNQLPSRDGAWGYTGICKKQPNPDTPHFVNEQAVRVLGIWRNYGRGCGLHRLPEPLIYYNPEYFWQSSEAVPRRYVSQPKNDEPKYQIKPKIKIQ